MIKLNHNVNKYLDARTGQVIIRVRWNNKKEEVKICLPVKADSSKWDSLLHRPKPCTVHKFPDKSFTAEEINSCMGDTVNAIEEAFSYFGLKEIVPTKLQLKNKVFPPATKTESPEGDKTLNELFEEFLSNRSSEYNWTEKVHYKYVEVWNEFKSLHRYIQVDGISKDKMLEYKKYLIENRKNKNSTIKKKFKCLKAFFRWLKKEKGFQIDSKVLDFDCKLKAIDNDIYALTMDELIAFSNFKFSKEYLSHIRDLFCFMCCTSLRHSDLKGLKRSDLDGNVLSFVSLKTKDRLRIPLIELAQDIADRSANKTGEYLFDVPTDQVFNREIKEAARICGLDREVMDISITGTVDSRMSKKIYEVISTKMGRKTFVTLCVKLGIPNAVVMACTGHNDYDTMRPYIAFANMDVENELVSKWNKATFGSKIQHENLQEQAIDIIKSMAPSELEAFLRSKGQS